MKILCICEIVFAVALSCAHAFALQTGQGPQRTFVLSNGVVTLSVTLDSGKIAFDKLGLNETWTSNKAGKPAVIVTSGDYGIDIFWTDWKAPGHVNNADNAVTLSKNEFSLVGSQENSSPGGGKQLDLLFQGITSPFELEVSYRIDSGAFYVHRRISIRDTVTGLHFLRKIRALDATLDGEQRVVKKGGFGQPVALLDERGGSSFWGVEYPASENQIEIRNGKAHLMCGEEIGGKIGRTWARSNWVVEGLAPDTYVKLWFMKYVKDIRIAPATPYTLFNSWYDLRSPNFADGPVSPDHITSEANILRLIDLLRRNMIEKHGIKLDAFVLDDGWDTYQSDWKPMESIFPHGLAPIVNELKKTNTALGLWFGPVGGYDKARAVRVDWMKAHGYETVGDELCLGGNHYSQLFKSRVVDFVTKDNVGYYKWDGIQFSCSEPGHGHPVGVDSRRAILDTLINICKGVREVNPRVYLNISSGTWLSPWWVKYANQIWMQAGDYGYSEIPSISPRDAAMTYRDLSLYKDFTADDLWFPIANLMTHGIIKGNLEQLGGENEPLDRFTNEAVFYFARGVSMWELYVSPDILSDGEWKAMSQSIQWATDRAPILSNTEMIGGDPEKGEAYGYVHFDRSKGTIAARNPWIDPSNLEVTLSSSLGFSSSADSLVLEEVYPDRWISPKLYSSGERIEIPLGGYETAIYEIFPLDSAHQPILAGVHFEKTNQDNKTYTIECYDAGKDLLLLNPNVVESILSEGKPIALKAALSGLKRSVQLVAITDKVKEISGKTPGFEFTLQVGKAVREPTLDLLLEPSGKYEKSPLPKVAIGVDGGIEPVNLVGAGSRSQWYTVAMKPGHHTVNIRLTDTSGWAGNASAWVSSKQPQQHTTLTFKLKDSAMEGPMPPRPLQASERETIIKVFEHKVGVNIGE